MIKILIIRHGQSVGNKEGKFCGSSYNCELSENGKLQGELVSDYIFNNYTVVSIYTSALIRAYQTVEKLSKLVNIKRIQMPEFNEIFGGVWEGKFVTEIASKFPSEYILWKTDIGKAQLTGGESWQSVIKRVDTGLHKIVEDNDLRFADNNGQKQKVIVLATHGGIVRLIDTIYRGLSLENMKDIPFVPNSSITTLIYDDGNFKIESSGYAEFLGNNITQVPKGM